MKEPAMHACERMELSANEIATALVELRICIARDEPELGASDLEKISFLMKRLDSEFATLKERM